jgi:uncharacterized protein
MPNLSLSAISRGGGRARWDIPKDDPLWDGSDLVLVEPVHVEVEAQPIIHGGVLVRGRIRAHVQLQCRRCLTTVLHHVDEPIELLFEPLAGKDEEELAGEVYPLPSRGDELELGLVIREQLLLLVPAFVVCTEECRGMCPHCGTDLNRGLCDCSSGPQPSEWDALRNLRFD